MAKKRSQRPESVAPDRPSQERAGAQPTDPNGAEASELDAAREAVQRAKDQLREARRAYWGVRRQAVDQLKQLREMSLGELADETRKRVKRHPGPSVLIAALVGFFLGRLFRR